MSGVTFLLTTYDLPVARQLVWQARVMTLAGTPVAASQDASRHADPFQCNSHETSSPVGSKETPAAAQSPPHTGPSATRPDRPAAMIARPIEATSHGAARAVAAVAATVLLVAVTVGLAGVGDVVRAGAPEVEGSGGCAVVIVGTVGLPHPPMTASTAPTATHPVQRPTQPTSRRSHTTCLSAPIRQTEAARNLRA